MFQLKTIKTLFALAAFAAASTNALAADKPNIVVIYGDDVGYGDVGAYGSKMIPTPNIDKLAQGGIVFTDGHCSAATCTPSRFSLLTGVHGFRHGVRILPPNAPLSIPTNILTLPKMLKKAGYETAVIGKWHLGLGEKGKSVDWNGDVKPGPIELGFDYSFLLPSTNDRVPCVYLENYRVLNLDPKDPLSVGKGPHDPRSTVYPDGRKNPESMTYYPSSHGHNNSVINGIGRIGEQRGGKSALWNDETMADEFVKQAKKFIAQKHEKPFFLYFASQDIHVPRAPHPRFQGKTKLGFRGDAMVAFDWAAGEILNELEKQGLSENTIIIFSSDNGPVYDDGYKDGTTVRTSSKESDRGHDGSGVYRGGKYQIYEGGTRVPFIIRWPARIKPGKSAAMVNQIDLLSSLAKLVEVEIDAEEARDSRDTLDAFLGDDKIGLPYMIEEARGLALRRGQWKFIPGKKAKKNKKSKTTQPAKKNKGQLYKLDTDPSEANNVIDQNPEVAKGMAELLQKLIDAGRVRK